MLWEPWETQTNLSASPSDFQVFQDAEERFGKQGTPETQAAPMVGQISDFSSENYWCYCISITSLLCKYPLVAPAGAHRGRACRMLADRPLDRQDGTPPEFPEMRTGFSTREESRGWLQSRGIKNRDFRSPLGCCRLWQEPEARFESEGGVCQQRERKWKSRPHRGLQWRSA